MAVVTNAQPHLLEREDALSGLVAHLQHVARTSTGLLCLVGGEAGVGKTTLVRRFNEGHPASRLLWGACDPLSMARPLGPFADMGVVHGEARPHEVAAGLLAQLRHEGPTVVVIEDLHWGDEATLDVMRLLSRRVGSAPALVIATYRDDELGRTHPVRVLLGEMASHESVVRIKLHALSAGAVATLATARGVDVDELYRKTAGNPFFVTEVLASPADEIPETVRDAVLARAARLSKEARTLLDAVAVAQPEAELSLLERVSPDANSALGECLDSGMLTRGNGSVAFRHELARQAVEDTIAPDRLLQLHRSILIALAGTDDPTRLAHHAAAANDDGALLRFGREAGKRASAVGAHREAAAQLARSLPFAGILPAGEHAELLQDYAQECLHLARTDDAIEAQLHAVDLFRQSGDGLHQADGLRRLSRLYMCGVRGAEAAESIHAAIHLLEQGPPTRELALAYSGLTMFHMNRDEVDDTRRAARRALELAEQFSDQLTELHTLNSLGSAELATGDVKGRDKLLRSLDMATELGLDEEVGRAYFNLASCMVRARMYDGLTELLSRGVDFCFEHGLDLWAMWLLTSQAQASLDQGDWSSATEVAERVMNGERGQLPRISALPVLALVRARRGDPGVWPLLDEARAMAVRQGELQFDAPLALARAEAAWLEGRADAVEQETQGAIEKARDRDAWWVMGELACWRHRVGIREPVEPRLPERYRAEIEGDLARAAELWSGLGCDYEAALALAQAEDDSLLRQALQKMQRLGARATASIVARKLRERGARGITRGPRAATQRNPAQLTERELEILQLVHGGMHNAGIARRLFLAPKTVDHHVSAILHKLSVATRTEAARKAERLGLFG